MTIEKLYSERDIAAELAHRDIRVEELEEALHRILITEDSYDDEQTVLGEIYKICRDTLESN